MGNVITLSQWLKASTWDDDLVENVGRPTHDAAIKQAKARIEVMARVRGRLTLNRWEQRIMVMECTLMADRRRNSEKPVIVEIGETLHMDALEVTDILNHVGDIESARVLSLLPPLEGKMRVAPVLAVVPRVRNEPSKHYRHKASWKRAA